jgi:hypothetical protein
MDSGEQRFHNGLTEFFEAGWELKHNISGTNAILEKTVLGVPTYLAVLASVFFGIIGAWLVNKRRKKQTITLSLREDGLLQVSGKNVAKVVQDPIELSEIAEIDSGIGSGGLYTIAIIATIVFFIASSTSA